MTKTWRLGPPQIFAGLLLLAFAAQCTWVVASRPIVGELRPGPLNGDVLHRELPPPVLRLFAELAGSIGFALAGGGLRWVRFIQFVGIAFGLLRGAAIWYVARRLYGNAGGFVALTLYCFSPRMVNEAASPSPEVLASWGFFGVVFVAVALAHTLHAPPKNRIWRTALLGIALALAFGSQYSAVLALVFAAAFMLYLVPKKRGTSLLALAGAVAVAAVLVAAAARFHPGYVRAILNAPVLDFTPWGVTPLRLLPDTLGVLLRPHNAALIAMLVISLVTFVVWKRARYFGNAAPLIVAASMFSLGYFMPSPLAWEHLDKALPFAMVFVGGMFADLLDIPGRQPVYRTPILAVTWLLLISHATLGLAALPGFARM